MAAATLAMPTVTLSSSSAMPMIAMGCGSMKTDLETTISAFIEAIKVGYRHFGTAAMCGTEQALGQAIAEAFTLGLIQSRDDIFITTKLWCNCAEAGSGFSRKF